MEIKQHSRAPIVLTTTTDINKFVAGINSDGSANKYTIENFDGTLRVNARSLMGVMYASMELGRLYLVNETVDGHFPSSIDLYRVLE